MKNNIPPFHFDYNENQMVMQNIQEFYMDLHHYFEEHTNYFEKISQLPKHLNYEDGLNIVRDCYIFGNSPLIFDYNGDYEYIDLNDIYHIILDSYPFSLFFKIELLEKEIGLTGNLIQRVKEILNSFNSEIITQDLVYNPKHLSFS